MQVHRIVTCMHYVHLSKHFEPMASSLCKLWHAKNAPVQLMHAAPAKSITINLLNQRQATGHTIDASSISCGESKYLVTLLPLKQEQLVKCGRSQHYQNQSQTRN